MFCLSTLSSTQTICVEHFSTSGEKTRFCNTSGVILKPDASFASLFALHRQNQIFAALLHIFALYAPWTDLTCTSNMCMLKLGQHQVAGVVHVIFGIMMRRILWSEPLPRMEEFSRIGTGSWIRIGDFELRQEYVKDHHCSQQLIKGKKIL